MTAENPTELRFPRWLEESGLPLVLNESAGPHAWPVFYRLVAHEVESNLIPQACTVDLSILERHTGIPIDALAPVLDSLQEAGVLEVIGIDPPNMRYEIPVPLPFPEDPKSLRQRLSGLGIDAERVYLRYAQPIDTEDRFRRVVQLYQALYGLRYSARTVQSLERIAVECTVGDILQVFSDAHIQGGRSFSWVKGRLLARQA